MYNGPFRHYLNIFQGILHNDFSGDGDFHFPPCAYLLFFFSFISFILLLLPFHIIIHVKNFLLFYFLFDLFIVVLLSVIFYIFCYFTGTTGSLYFISLFFWLNYIWFSFTLMVAVGYSCILSHFTSVSFNI